MMIGFGLIVALILIGVVAYTLGLRPKFDQTYQPQIGQNPVEILKARYAGGEISRRWM